MERIPRANPAPREGRGKRREERKKERLQQLLSGRMTRKMIQRARSLRQRQTPSEAKMWSLLRNRRFQNAKFRRQHPIGPYITDFCSIEYKLVIEIDGSGHLYEEQKEKDRVRDYYLEQHGYTVLRFWSNDLYDNLDGVMEAIWGYISSY